MKWPRVTKAVLLLFLGGCVSLPEGIVPVKEFDLERYLGTWYEIARLDHSFERGLSHVTAEYSRREDGGVKVVNRGYSAARGGEEAVGRAYFVNSSKVGQLKVSFFGPFYGGYNIFALDHEDYQWALVCGPSRDYLWILGRTPKLAPELVSSLVKKAEKQGFLTNELIWVEQSE